MSLDLQISLSSASAERQPIVTDIEVTEDKRSAMPIKSNQQWLHKIRAAQLASRTCLPQLLGLDEASYLAVFSIQPKHAADDLRQQLLEMRKDEWQDLWQMLSLHKAEESVEAVLVAKVVAAACLGANHLWRDLGLDSREQLHELLQKNFPTLVEANHADMKWKKFFYKQLCEAGGGYVCRAPSCEQCVTYDDCFGPEI